MSKEATTAVKYLSDVCLVVFGLEILMKVIGYGKRFFRDNWNRFDFLIVVLSIVADLLQNVFGLTTIEA